MPRSLTQVADKFLEAGIITREAHHRTLQHFQERGGFIEEALIETRSINEEVLLKQLAHMYRTRYVATEKLRRADIPRDVLDLVSLKIAQKYTVFPIMYDKRTDQLLIVSVDPTNLVVEQEVSQGARVRSVKSFVARPDAIKAAIEKFYKGDLHAFANVDRESMKAYQSMMDVYERNLLDKESLSSSLANEGSRAERIITPDQLEESSARAVPDFLKTTDGEGGLITAIGIVRVMVSLLESNRGELAGHSVQTANQTERMCKRLGLAPRDTAATILAALLHDLGKGSPYHLTAFNVAEWDGHRIAAQKRFENPLRLFEAITLPEATVHGLKQMYERYDGLGFPGGMTAKDISLSARVLAITDTFTDLTSNPRNPYRRTLSTEEAMKVLATAKGKVFDPNLVDLFAMVAASDGIKQAITGSQTILVVDPDPEQCAILDLQLTSRGFKVRMARSAETAVKVLAESAVHLIIAEVELEPTDGFEFKRQLSDHPQYNAIPFLFFTARSASIDVERAFKLGAQDYLIKPSTVDILAAKISNNIGKAPERAQTGVSGSLKEMSLPDLVQILSHGRKTGQLKLSFGAHRGEIHFVNGDINTALLDNMRGEEAFFQMLRFKDGTFALNPIYKPGPREIQLTAEMLLLEGLRRFDEDNR